MLQKTIKERRQVCSHTRSAFNISILWIAASVGIIMNLAKTANATSLKVTQTAVIPIDLNPTHIRRGTDGNYVVTGTRSDFKKAQRAGAIGLDSSGKMLWQYSSPVFDPQISPPSSQSYANSVEMADGSIFLCGLAFNAPQIGEKKVGITADPFRLKRKLA